MKKIILFSSLILSVVFTACGPAAENREQMHIRAKVFQDSIANVIKTSIAESSAPNAGHQVIVAPAQPATTTAAPTATAK